METPLCQRWKGGRGLYRPAGEVVVPREYDVAAITSDRVAKEFIAEHHYLKSYPAAMRRFGLYRKALLVGVSVFSHPVNNASFDVLPGSVSENLELGRLVLLDSVPGNGESWFVCRCFGALKKEGFVGVISFCDPLPRQNANGDIVFQGHVGTVYQALSAVYLGRSKPGVISVMPDGTVMHRRAIQKIRNREQGWEAAARRLVASGAPSPGGDIGEWVAMALDSVCHRVRHPGNHKYAWALSKKSRRYLPASLAYPKISQGRSLF